jgi:hypothetical protein
MTGRAIKPQLGFRQDMPCPSPMAGSKNEGEALVWCHAHQRVCMYECMYVILYGNHPLVSERWLEGRHFIGFDGLGAIDWSWFLGASYCKYVKIGSLGIWQQVSHEDYIL